MFRWLQNRMAHGTPQDLRPRPRMLAPEPPRAISINEADQRLDAMLSDKDFGFRTWPELIAWLEHRAASLRDEKANLQDRKSVV